MKLQEETGRIAEWKPTKSKKKPGDVVQGQPEVKIFPLVVNLNKNSSNDKDRYLCLNFRLVLKELMPDQEIPKFHPKAREAVIIFLSSLIFNDVRNFDNIKEQNAKMIKILNPYMDMLIEKIDIEHVIIAQYMEQVEEFIIEHTMITDEEGTEGEGKEDQAKKEDKKTG
ncbi:MAG: flagellar basal body-associated FliL family protein [Desulfobacteraceae bacterium]|nr:flagellar basal body-associated FliL family protein [Desulfobacteraceae bacterium]